MKTEQLNMSIVFDLAGQTLVTMWHDANDSGNAEALHRVNAWLVQLDSLADEWELAHGD